MKIRKIKNNVLDRLKDTAEEIKLTMFEKDNYIYKISTIKNQNIIIVYKEDVKSEFFETELFEII